MQVAERHDIVFDPAGTRRMSEIYAPCLTLILQLRSTSDYGDAEVLRSRIKNLLDRSDHDLRRNGHSDEEVREARFALVAFIDETILSSNWRHKDRWLARPLQLELYERFDAGEEFFGRLETLMREDARNADLVEVFYLCMTLGFKGMYQIHDQEQLRQIIDDTAAFLQLQPGIATASLSPRGRPRGQLAAEVRSTIPPWVVAAVALAIALITYMGVRWYASSTAADAATTIEEYISARPGS